MAHVSYLLLAVPLVQFAEAAEARLTDESSVTHAFPVYQKAMVVIWIGVVDIEVVSEIPVCFEGGDGRIY